MKSIFITFDQAYSEQILTLLSSNHVRGYTEWETVKGRGSKSGDPHLGSHAWPTQNSSILTVVEDDKVKKILSDLKVLDATSDRMGIRAFVWNIEDGM